MTRSSLLATCCLLAAVGTVVWPGRFGQARRRLAAIDQLNPPGPIRGAGRVWRQLRDGKSLPAATATGIAAGLLACAAAVLAGTVAGLAVGAYGYVAVRTVRRSQADRIAVRSRRHALDALCALAADLRAGASPAAAFRIAAEGGHDRLTGRVSALQRLAEQTGAPLAELLERIAADARAADRIRATAAAQAAGARATAWLLAALPAGGIALGYAIGADPLSVLLHTPIGAACLLGAVVLQVAGLAWADRLIQPAQLSPGAGR